MNNFSLKIISPAGVVFDGNAWQLSARDFGGSFSLRANHAPFFAIIPAGTMEVADTPESRSTIAVEHGIIEFSGNACTVICG